MVYIELNPNIIAIKFVSSVSMSVIDLERNVKVINND